MTSSPDVHENKSTPRRRLSQKTEPSKTLRSGKPLGRRPGDNLTRDQILDAAEQAFAAGGYVGTSLRGITSRAGVNTALVQYYFGSKEGLLTAVFLRRGHELARERIAMLDAIEAAHDRTPSVADIVTAYLAPAFNLKRRGAGGAAFMRLHSRLQTEPSGVTEELRTSIYEEPIQRFVRALCRALPDLDITLIYWRITFMIGAYFHTISDTNRLNIISGGRCSSKNLDEAFQQLLQFFVAGLSAPPPSG